MLRAVTLDYWNTLFVDSYGAARERRRADCLRTELAAIGFNSPAGAIQEVLRDAFTYFEHVWRHEQRTPACAELIDHMLAVLHVRPPQEVVTRIVTTFEHLLLEIPPDPVPSLHAVVYDLASHYRLGVICDTGYSPGTVLRTLLRRVGILDAFSSLYFSNEGPYSKPHPYVFRTVLEQLEARPTEAAHVGDMQRTDILGAQAAGMWAVHFVGANNRDATISTADAIVRHFEELPAALGNLRCAGCCAGDRW
ncbi:MAG: HAD family hydrolase [Actinobacteria bacterium]|nr:HAD family hydrolase [Actinomycetota bacterium]